MIPKRVITNLIVFLGASGFLIALGLFQLVLHPGSGPKVSAEFSESSGLAARNDVTMRGVTVGRVEDLRLTPTGVEVNMALDRGVEVPANSRIQIVRRSPIGDFVVEITPGSGPVLPSGGKIPMAQTAPAPDAGKTVEALAKVLHAVPPKDIQTVVSELADAVEGRGSDLARLSVATADLPERILTVDDQLERLIVDGTKVTGTLARNADVLADDITRTEQLMDILRDRRYDLLDLYRNGARFTEVAGGLIRAEKPNIACLISDLGDINRVLSEPVNLANLAATLGLNHYFFDGVEQSVQKGLDGRIWFRVQLEPMTQPQGYSYHPHLEPPDVYAGNSCTSRYGAGVGPGTQSGPVEVLDGTTIHPGK